MPSGTSSRSGGALNGAMSSLKASRLESWGYGSYELVTVCHSRLLRGLLADVRDNAHVGEGDTVRVRYSIGGAKRVMVLTGTC